MGFLEQTGSSIEGLAAGTMADPEAPKDCRSQETYGAAQPDTPVFSPSRSKDAMKFYTLGHSNRSLADLTRLLAEHGIGCLVDIRSRPGSGRFPWFNKTALERTLREVGVRYAWEGHSLGGLRPEPPDAIRHGALAADFRPFAAHMDSAAFRAGIDRLIEHAASHRTALFCAERHPGQCHRSLIADYLTVRGYEVRHLLDISEKQRHELHPAAWLEGHGLCYRADTPHAATG